MVVLIRNFYSLLVGVPLSSTTKGEAKNGLSGTTIAMIIVIIVLVIIIILLVIILITVRIRYVNSLKSKGYVSCKLNDDNDKL